MEMHLIENSLYQNQALLVRLHLEQLFFLLSSCPSSVFQGCHLLRDLQTQSDCFPVSRLICQTKQEGWTLTGGPSG